MTISPIQMLHGSNFKKWKSDIELNLGILDFDHVLTEDPPAALPANPTRERKEVYERWYKHNKMALICIKRSMTDNVKGGVPFRIWPKPSSMPLLKSTKHQTKKKLGL